MSVAAMSFVANKADAKTKRTTRKKSPINRARMEHALNSGEATQIPHGLSREEMRQFILNAS